MHKYAPLPSTKDKVNIKCEILSSKLDIDLLPDTTQLEEHLVYLEKMDENRRDASTANKSHNKHVEAQYDKCVYPHILFEGDIVLFYNQHHDHLGTNKFKSMWLGPYIIN